LTVKYAVVAAALPFQRNSYKHHPVAEYFSFLPFSFYKFAHATFLYRITPNTSTVSFIFVGVLVFTELITKKKTTNEKITKLSLLPFRIEKYRVYLMYSRVIMNLTKFVMQPTIHVLHMTEDC
jgi:hypothetical protein